MSWVLFVDHHAEIIGGGQLSLLGLMENLDPRRYLPRLVCPGGGRLAAAARQEGIAVDEVEMPSLRAPLAVLGAVRKIRRLMGQREVALLHANSSRSMFYAGLAGRRSGTPVIWHVRIAEAERNWDRFLGGMARLIAVNSQAARRRFAGSGLEDKVRVVYNGEDLERYARADGAALRRELGGAPLIGMVGRLSPEKDHETFLQAASRVAENWPQARFAIVGEDPEPGQPRRRALEQLAGRLGLGEQVVFTGARQDIPELMAALDLLVHCAHHEAFGRVLVEAMAAARPVVATAVGGIPEVVGECGLLVPEGDAAGVARAVESLLADADAARHLGAAGKRRAELCFSVEAHATTVQALYDGLLPG